MHQEHIHLAYWAVGESNRRARQVYEDQYPNRKILQQQMLARVHRNLCERVSGRK